MYVFAQDNDFEEDDGGEEGIDDLNQFNSGGTDEEAEGK